MFKILLFRYKFISLIRSRLKTQDSTKLNDWRMVIIAKVELLSKHVFF